VEQILKNALAGTLQGSLPQALESVFQSLDSALANRSITINAPPLPTVGLNLDGHLHDLKIAALDSLRATLSLAVKTDHSTPVHPSSRGVALIDTSTADPLFDSPRSQLSVRMLVLNGLLHNLWNSGLLEVPVSSSIPLSISAKLPPSCGFHGKGRPKTWSSRSASSKWSRKGTTPTAAWACSSRRD
jgi:hypothetical protein